MTERVTRRDAEGLCTLMLNRPDKLNALDTPVFEELDAHLAALEGETGQIGCVVLRGAGRGFISSPTEPPASPIPMASGGWSARGACRNVCPAASACPRPSG